MKHRIWTIIIAAVWILAVSAHAADTTGADQPGIETEVIPTADVSVDGAVLFPVRGVTAYPAEKRAEVIAGRIKAVAADHSISAGDLRVADVGDRSNILAKDRLIMSVVDADARVENADRHLLAEIYMTRITDAIQTYRQNREPRALMISTGYAVAATGIFIAALLGLRWLFRLLGAKLARRYQMRLHDLKIQSFNVLRAEQLISGLTSLTRTLRLLIVVVLLYAYLNFVLGIYPWTRALAQRLFAMVIDPLGVIATGFLATVPDLIFLAILTVVVWYILRMVGLFLKGIERKTVTVANFDPEWAVPTYRILRFLIIAFALVVAYPYIPGSSSEAFKGISIFLGIVFSLGSSSMVANVIAGYALIYRRVFKVGDRIRIDEYTGDVMSVTAQVTHLRSLKNEEITIPNSIILNSQVTNYSSLAQEQGLILHTSIGIGYETPWRQVEAMLLQAAGRTSGILKDPAPFILQKQLGDFCVTYELNAYSDQPQMMNPLYTALHRNILDVFNEHRVQIMTPAYEGDPEQPKVVPRDRWYAPPAQPPAGTEQSGQTHG
jgi:small-conductance mechanosensitive channel